MNFNDYSMFQLRIALLALVRVGITGAIFYAIGSWLGKPIEVLALALAVFLFWHIFSGRWLATQLTRDPNDLKDNLAFLPLTYEDIQLFRAIRDHDNELNRREMMKASSESLPDGVIVIDAENKVLQTNLKAEEFLGVRYPDDIGQRIDNLVRYPRFVRFLGETDTEDFDDDNDSIEINSPFNEQVRIRITCKHFAESLRMLVIQDVTAFHRVNKVRQDFVGNASHELRTPLTVIRGYLEEMIDDEEIPRFWLGPMNEIEKQTLRMQNIINDMLTLSNLESRPRLAEAELVNLAVLIQQVRLDLSQAFQNSHIIIDNVPTDIFIKGEESELYSIFSNLVKNACLYSPENTEVSISYQNIQADHQIVVRDQGPGIPESSINRLTERFYRVDDGRSREKGGTGLGLAIVKHALMRHEGYLSIESEIDKGSRFICHFPPQRIEFSEGLE